MFGETTGQTLTDILNRQTLKPKSPIMRGEIMRTLDLEHMFQLDQVSHCLHHVLARIVAAQSIIAHTLPHAAAAFAWLQEGAYCRDGYLYEGNIFQCCPEFKVRFVPFIAVDGSSFA